MKNKSIFENFKLELIDETYSRRWFLEWLHDGCEIKCPRCGFPLQENRCIRFFDGKISYCSSCGKKYFPFKGTLFHSTKLTFAELVLIMLLQEFEIPINVIAKLLRRQPVAVKTAAKKIEKIKKGHTQVWTDPENGRTGQI